MNEATGNERREPPAASVAIAAGGVTLQGDLALPPDPIGVVMFAHGSGSSRHSPRNRQVAQVLQRAKMGTLLLDLLTEEEEGVDARTAELRFDIDFLARRLLDATGWLKAQAPLAGLRLGYFGASTGAAAALMAAASAAGEVAAVVSRGGRPDLAGRALGAVQAPTLLIVGSDDRVVLDLNHDALAQLRCQKQLQVIPGATHLFEEPGTLDQAARLARQWFERHLGGSEAGIAAA